MNDHQPINIPQVPDDATLWPSDTGLNLEELKAEKARLDQEEKEVNEKLLACKDAQIKQLTEIVELQKQLIARLEEQVNTLLFGGGCGGSCGSGRD